MTDLRQRLHERLDTQHTDVLVLTVRAQQQGARLRRRQRLAAATGSLAMAAAIAAGVASASQLLPGPQERPSASSFASQAGGTAPATGASVVAALYSAVEGVADGTGDRFRGGTTKRGANAGEQTSDAAGGMFAFTPAGASTPGEVSISVSHQVQPGILWDAQVPHCPADALDCKRTQLADGTEVVSFRLHADETTNGDPAGRDTVYAERLVADVLVTVSAANGLFSPELAGEQLPNQPSAVLSAAQLVEIVSQTWWGLELPSRFSESELPSYTELPGGAGMLYGS